MHNIRNKIEDGFARFARRIYRHRIKTILIMLLATTAVVSQIPKITVDTSMEGFLHPDDPAMLAYNAFRDQFGRDDPFRTLFEQNRSGPDMQLVAGGGGVLVQLPVPRRHQRSPVPLRPPAPPRHGSVQPQHRRWVIRAER